MNYVFCFQIFRFYIICFIEIELLDGFQIILSIYKNFVLNVY